ncbi:type VI secretion system Vgr family protein [Cronobacter dublinensis]|uniref:type VI secretion system Vgr family protein n=1 Tax=Cronobacter dublinensis TaxID=413497 RepID=UPI001375693C|nr:type VI secretion system tip protein TssI/VgrG [Cronobacter dublinensis]NCH72602.1 type VI secretion system tip protein VgrG [Cronobacter dublinensis]
MERIIVAHTPLPPETLLFKSLSGTEQLSALYEFDVEFLSPFNDLDIKGLLGKPVTIEIRNSSLTPRLLNGDIIRLSQEGQDENGERYYRYRATLCPALWYLTQNRDFRIWQEKTVPEIIRALLNEYQIPFELQLCGEYRNWGYCVQYNESDFDFISRLMEHEGIYYYFRHESESQTLVITDSPFKHRPLQGYDIINWNIPANKTPANAEGIHSWRISGAITPSLYSHDDYDFRKPRARLFEARENPRSFAARKAEIYDWPGRYTDHQHGQNYVKVRQQELESKHEQMSGSATSLGIAPGFTFRFAGAPRREDEGEYLTVRATYLLTENPYTSSAETPAIHQIDFDVVSADLNWRPQRNTPWPRTYGPQTAEVVGPQGEPIWTDKYGRVKVKFRWDRYSETDDSCSCWVRVSSTWAGWKYGGMQIPRVGEEVVVDFINGDPDRPIITGRVYNEESMPPWDLPADATRMGFMSRSKSGSQDNANYLFMEDRLGQESFDMHAERDMNVSVENDLNVHVEGNRNLTVDKHDTQTLKDSSDISVTGYLNKTITQNMVTNSSATISNGAKNIMFSASEKIIYGQTVDKENKASISAAPSDANAKVPHISKPGTFLPATASYNNPPPGSDVIYRNGVATHIEGYEKRTIDKNQVIDVKMDAVRNVKGDLVETVEGNISRATKGTWKESVLGEITITSPQKITIKSDVEVNIDAPYWSSNAKFHSESYALNSLTMNGSSETIGTLSLGTNAINVSYNHIDGGFKHIDLTKQNIQVAMNAKIRLLSGAISTLANKLLMVF